MGLGEAGQGGRVSLPQANADDAGRRRACGTA